MIGPVTRNSGAEIFRETASEVVQVDHAPAGVRRDVLPVEPVRPPARVARRAVAQDRKSAPFPRPRPELLGPRHLLDVLLGQALQGAEEPLLPAGGEDDPLRVQEEDDPLAPLAELPLDRPRGNLDHRDADGRGGRIPVHRMAEVDAADVRRHPLRHVGGRRSPDRLLPVRTEGEIVPDEAVRRVPVAGRDRRPVPVHDVADVGREGVPEVVEDGVRPREGRSPGMGQDLRHLLQAGEGTGRLQVLGEERGDPGSGSAPPGGRCPSPIPCRRSPGGNGSRRTPRRKRRERRGTTGPRG